MRTSRNLFLIISTVCLVSTTNSAQAIPPQQAPAELKNLLIQMDAAASKGDVKTVMGFYSPNFTHGDGLTRPIMEKALTSLWKRYPTLRYTTQLESWQKQGNTIIANTVTQISGLPSANNNNLSLNATIKSRQQISGTKILRQDILSERTQLTSGAKPPKLDIKLPQQVKAGQQYTFDAIVQEPLGDDYLLGAALDEPVKPEKYLSPTSLNLELLSAGGLFKTGRAPAKPGSQWISAVIMRGDGITMVTQRMEIKK
ncbi:hypothetical protein [Calothrix sp. PCC 6303]|uniref:hypothetical protein n=1 Tax=Calothrix sp. PCC 6303 TaxID=1170562 RepID=UPI0002A02795|nr:hypothetical protein [Calothrix sp. PCC 6303]AFZ03935.1 hypothetical protein Cal6303_5046 [Calothrix sp. PCC 6303]